MSDLNNESEEPLPRDLLLSAFVTTIEAIDAEQPDAEAPLSLSLVPIVGGAIVSGMLISQRLYFRAFGERLRRSIASLNLDASPLERVFVHAANVAQEVARLGPANVPTHLHLREAYILSPIGFVPTPKDAATEGLLLRIPLDSVDAFTIARLSAETGR
jgi:hypothetical protein